MKETKKAIIGRNALVDFGDEVLEVPAKVDTGADSSAVWASDIFVDKEHLLHFKLFAKGSRFYTGVEHVADKYSVALTRSSSGDMMLKFRTKILVKIDGHEMLTTFGLSDRSTHMYPILIGRKTLHGHFMVDVENEYEVELENGRATPKHLNAKMRENPYKFYKEYYLNYSDDEEE
jgi:hypothetical protein